MTLKMTLSRRWFDMIESGEKKEEYRELKPFWHSRLRQKAWRKLPPGSTVQFFNGPYCGGRLPMIEVELLGISIGEGRPRWGAAKDTDYYILQLGNVVERRNLK